MATISPTWADRCLNREGNDMTASQSMSSSKVGSTESLAQCVAAMQRHADDAVKQLNIADFIRANEGAICGQLEQIDSRVSKAAEGNTLGLNSDADFIAQSLPLINGVILVGSNRQNINAATTWVKEQRPDADPISLLSTLTLVYIVKQAREDACKDAEKEIAEQARASLTAPVQQPTAGQAKKTRWEGIYRRIQWLCEKSLSHKD
jgi:hypothetical protein